MTQARRQLFSEEYSVDTVIDSLGEDTDPRLREIMTSLIFHIHQFVKDVELTEGEWERGIDFLTRTGQTCSDVRQEFILLSDVLGVSMLVETINHRAFGQATEQTVLGPFHMVDSPPQENGASIARDGAGEACVVTGTVTDVNGLALAGASVDVWQANADGFYDVQQPGLQPDGNLRGLFTTDINGQFWFRSIVPRYYPIPADGPVGELLAATGRHPNRPAHVHFIVSAAGHSPITTHLFVNGTPYIDSDVVFGVKESLIRDFETVDDPAQARKLGVDNPFRSVHFDVVLLPSNDK